MLDLILDATSCMNGRKMIMLSLYGKEKQIKKNIAKNIESIKRQIHNLIWQIQEVKCTKDSGWE